MDVLTLCMSKLSDIWVKKPTNNLSIFSRVIYTVKAETIDTH